MLFLEDLFKRENVTYPKWLVQIRLEEEWRDSKYESNGDDHLWILKNDVQNLKVTCNQVECRFEGFDDQGRLIFTEIYTKDSHIIT